MQGSASAQKKFDRLHEAIKTSVQWSTMFCVVVGLIFILFPVQIVSQFTKDDINMVEIGAIALRANGFSFMFFGFHTVYSSLFFALGKGREGFILGTCRQGICFVPVIFILPIFWGINGILYAQPIADLITVIVTVVMAVPLNKKLNEMQRQVETSNT